jgi:hypothetical protein
MDIACAGWCSCCQNSETNSSLKKFWNSCLKKFLCCLCVCVCVCVCEREREREREKVFQRCHELLQAWCEAAANWVVWWSAICDTVPSSTECFFHLQVEMVFVVGGHCLSQSDTSFFSVSILWVVVIWALFVCFHLFFLDGYYFPLALSIWSSPLHSRFAAHKQKLRAQESLRERMDVQVSASQSDRCIVVPCTYLMAPCFHPWSYHCAASKECLLPLHNTKQRVHHHPW